METLKGLISLVIIVALIWYVGSAVWDIVGLSSDLSGGADRTADSKADQIRQADRRIQSAVERAFRSARSGDYDDDLYLRIAPAISDRIDLKGHSSTWDAFYEWRQAALKRSTGVGSYHYRQIEMWDLRMQTPLKVRVRRIRRGEGGN